MSHSYQQQQQQYPFDSRSGGQGDYYAVDGATDSRANLNSAGFAYPPEKNYPTSTKMPVYKRWWFWLIIVVAIAGEWKNPPFVACRFDACVAGKG